MIKQYIPGVNAPWEEPDEDYDADYLQDLKDQYDEDRVMEEKQ